MKLYRIARAKYAHDLSGNGGIISAARWHSHMPVIYASCGSSTCILEKLVHLAPDEIHNDLLLITLEIDDNVATERLPANQLPPGWKDYPAPLALRRIGNAWLTLKSAVVLFVPSVIDPLAENVLINPQHENIKSITVKDTQPFTYDERLLYSRRK